MPTRNVNFLTDELDHFVLQAINLGISGKAPPSRQSAACSAARRRIQPLGVERFGQSGDTLDLYRAYGIDAEAILDAVAMATVEECKGSRELVEKKSYRK